MRVRSLASGLGSILVVASAAIAADLPPQQPPARAPAMVVAERYSWTGVYIGAHGGYGWDKLTGTDTTSIGTSSVNLAGWLAGGQIGANYQMGPVVIGIQGDYAYADIKKSLTVGAGAATVKNDYLATASARIGYAFDRVLVYAKGGGAWTRDKVSITDGIGGSASGNFNRTGWLAGAGVEWAIAGNFTAFAEYNYMGFGSVAETPTGTIVLSASNVSAKMQIGKAGINYRF